MSEVCKISELTRNREHHVSTKHCVSTMICNPPQTFFFCDCSERPGRHVVFFFCDYSECPGPTDLENTLDVFTDNAFENIAFKQWISTDRCELITILKSTEEYIESLLEILLLLLCHSFIHSLQHRKLYYSKN
jgi:hypothetical protein